MGGQAYRYTVEIKDRKTGVILLVAGADWTADALQVVLARNLRLAPPAIKDRRYVISIRDGAGKTRLYFLASWTRKQRDAAIAQNIRLAGLPGGSGLTDPTDYQPIYK